MRCSLDWYVGLFGTGRTTFIFLSRLNNIEPRTGYHSMPRTIRALFGVSVIMFLISVFHMGLVIQELTAVDVPLVYGRIQVVFAVMQARFGGILCKLTYLIPQKSLVCSWWSHINLEVRWITDIKLVIRVSFQRYRVWIIWNKNYWIVIGPLLTMVASAGMVPFF